MTIRTSHTPRRGFTMLELLVVVLILIILTGLAVNMFIGQVERARYAAARVQITALEMAIERYRIDVGQYPPGSSPTDTNIAPNSLNPRIPFEGNNYMYIALTRSMNGLQLNPLSTRWQGPYIKLDEFTLGTLNGEAFDSSTALTDVQILDPWGTPYDYVPSGLTQTPFNYPATYETLIATEIPADDPILANTPLLAGQETWFNMASSQFVSHGPNETTMDAPMKGLDTDDITSFDNRLKAIPGYGRRVLYSP